MATYSSTLAWKNPMDGEPGRLQYTGPEERDTTERLNRHTHFHVNRWKGNSLTVQAK